MQHLAGSLSPSSKPLKPRMFLETPALALGVRSESGLVDCPLVSQRLFFLVDTVQNRLLNVRPLWGQGFPKEQVLVSWGGAGCPPPRAKLFLCN